MGLDRISEQRLRRLEANFNIGGGVLRQVLAELHIEVYDDRQILRNRIFNIIYSARNQPVRSTHQIEDTNDAFIAAANRIVDIIEDEVLKATLSQPL